MSCRKLKLTGELLLEIKIWKLLDQYHYKSIAMVEITLEKNFQKDKGLVLSPEESQHLGIR